MLQMVRMKTVLLLTILSFSQISASTIFFTGATNTPTTAPPTQRTTPTTAPPTQSTTPTTAPPTQSTTPTTTTTTLKPLAGLRCIDPSDSSFPTPSYCVTNPFTGHFEISRITPLTFDEILPNAFNGLVIKSLNLSGLNIKKLNPTSFAGLDNLNTLYLSNNQIKELPDTIFSGLYKLNYLYLDNNQLERISPPMFNDPFGLKKVSLSHNKLSEIQAETFKNQGGLESLSLENNLFETLNYTMFSGLTFLKQLNLANNLLTNPDQDAFKSLLSLQTLNISHNNINNLVQNLFINQPYFNKFDASFNKLNDVSPLAFENCRSLSTILMNNNEITNIKDSSFQDLDSMDELNLSNNQLSSLTPDTLSGLTQLRYLILSNNKIPRLPRGWLDSLGNLDEVDLSNNRISVIDSRPFDSPKRIQKLDLSSNKLELIETGWFDGNDDMKKLNLRGNLIKEFKSDSFSDRSTLSTLDLGSNLLESEALVGTFKNLKQLKVLYLDDNSLTIFDADKASTPATIEELYLNATCVEEVRIQFFERVKKINLKSNYLHSITKDNIRKLTRLEELDLSDNNITVIDSDFIKESTNPTLLNFSMNALSSLEAAKLTSVPSLSQSAVDLTWNNIDSLQGINNINKFYISGNPLECSCDHLSTLNDYSSFGDYDKTLCKKEDNHLFLSCFLSDKSECTQGSLPVPINDLCSSNNTLKSLTMRPIIYKKSCKFPTPVIEFMMANSTESGFNVVWNSSNIDSLKWFKLSWQLEHSVEDTSNSTSNTTITSASTVWYKSKEMQFSNNLKKAGKVTVCVETEPVFVSIQKNIRCSSFPFNGPVSKSSLFPMLTYILIAVGILLLLIIFIIILAVCLRKRRNRRADQEHLEQEKKRRLEKSASVKSIVDPDVPEGIPEQSTVSIDMY